MMHRNIPAGFACLLAAALWASSVDSTVGDEPVSPKAPLAGLPSPPGKHVQQLNALRPGQWLLLEEPAADPQWGRARGRAYTPKMALASDLGGAFLYGEGVHGWWNRETGRYMDDLWFYDLLGHRWICVYPGADVDNLALKLDKNGVEVTESGQPIPVAPMVHGYEMMTYVPAERRFMFLPCPGAYWRSSLGKRRTAWLESLKVDPQQPRSDPRFYNVQTARWERVSAEAPGMRVGFCGSLIHLAKHHKTFFYMRKQDVWCYDHRQKTWSRAEPEGAPPSGKDYEGLSCYDPGRDWIYLCNDHEETVPCIYDVGHDAWIKPEVRGEPRSIDRRVMRSASGALHYDSAADRVLFFQYRTGDAEGTGVYSYDPNTHTWTSQPLPFPKEFRASPCGSVNSFYDPQQNVHVFHTAGDSRDNGLIWVYRHGSRT